MDLSPIKLSTPPSPPPPLSPIQSPNSFINNYNSDDSSIDLGGSSDNDSPTSPNPPTSPDRSSPVPSFDSIMDLSPINFIAPLPQAPFSPTQSDKDPMEEATTPSSPNSFIDNYNSDDSSIDLGGSFNTDSDEDENI
jgi:hypothetical protein